jgi:predicted ATPase/DNA-binding SARP family transcriptional activator/Tfp pilus assembly protein PilF
MTSVIAVSVQLLGGVRALVAGQEVTFSNDKRHQLLAFLAYAGDWVSREKLADLFYTDTSEVARQNLRRLLQRVQALEWLEQLEIERTRLRWKVETDYADFRKAFEANDLDRALNVYTGPFLQGLESYEDNEFATWLELERQRLHEQWREVIFKKARVSEPQQASNLFQRLLEQDEFDEEALLALMQVLHAGGQNQQALKTYQTFAERLKREMGLTPSSATQQFAEVLEQHKTAQPAITLSSNVSSSSSLPTPTTSFIGRDLELAEIASLLDENEVRLLTLLGPGGVGKTRIALQAASELARRYRDGAHFVSLESLTSPNAIPQAVAEALAITLQGQEELLEQVIDFLKVKNLLLVLDNFEHLVDGATIVSDFIRACPEVDILVTSRERLNLDEEHILSLEGLGIPNDKTSLEDALSYDAVVLFIERAKRVRSSFTLTKEELPAVLEICQLVQGFPLGIELAAAWVKLMPCQEIADEIAKNLDFLESSSRNALERHRSLRATFEYSWQLLTDKEQETLRKLSVFRGGFTREAASFVANANISLLAALVDKSLLRVLENRYDFHPLLHHYSGEKLANRQDIQRRHALFFLNFVETVEAQQGKEEATSQNRLEQNYDNVRAALEWSLASQNSQSALRFVAGLQFFWESRGYIHEGRAYTQKTLQQFENAPLTVERARGLKSAGNLALIQGDFAAARSYFHEMYTLATALNNDDQLAKALSGLAYVAYSQGDYTSEQTYYEKVLELSRTLGDQHLEALVLNNLGIRAVQRGDLKIAKELCEASLHMYRTLNDTSSVALGLINLGLIDWRLGHYDSATELLQNSLQISKEAAYQPTLILALSNLGVVWLDKGDEVAALNSSKEALRLRRDIGDKWGIAFSFESFANIAVSQSDFARAARLWGAAERLREEIGSPIQPSWRPRYERFVATAKEHVDETTFAAHWQEGRKMGLEQAVTYALE